MPYLSWVLIDFVDTYLDGLYEVCGKRCSLLRLPGPPKIKSCPSPLKEDAADRFAAQVTRATEFETQRRIATEILQAINVARTNPRAFVSRVSTAKTREGSPLVREAVAFLESAAPCLRVLEDTSALAETCVQAFQEAAGRPVRHTPHLASLMRGNGFGGCVVGEMFWCSTEMPADGSQIVTDFLLDDGVPNRSHRNGIFDREFQRFGAHFAKRANGEYAAFVHFADASHGRGEDSPEPTSGGAVAGNFYQHLSSPSAPSHFECGDFLLSRGSSASRSHGDPASTLPTAEIGMKKEQNGIRERGEIIEVSSSTDDAEREDSGRVEEPQGFRNLATLPPMASETRTEENAPRLEPSQLEMPRKGSSPATETNPRQEGPPVGVRRRPKCEEGTSLPGTPTLLFPVLAQSPSCGEAGPRRKSSKKNIDQCVGDSRLGVFSGVCDGERGGVPQLNASGVEEPESGTRCREGQPSTKNGGPGAVVQNIQRILREEQGSPRTREEGLSPFLFSSTENKFLRAEPSIFGLFVEDVSNILLFQSARDDRNAYKSIMELFQKADKSRVTAAALRVVCEPHGRAATRVVDRFLDEAELVERGDDFELVCVAPTLLPWQSATGVSKPAVLLSARQASPPLPPPSIGESVPLPIKVTADLPDIVAPLALFVAANRGSSKAEMLFKWIRELRFDVTNSPKLLAETMWIFFEESDENERRLVYAKEHGWMVYNGRWLRDEPKFLQATPLLQGPFNDCVLAVLRINRRRNIWRHSAEKPHARVDFLLDAQKKMSDHTGVQYLLAEPRPYFIRKEPFDADPMILQLQTAVVDLRVNRIRASAASDYTSKASPLFVPANALSGGSGVAETPEEAEARAWTWSLLWSVFKKDEDGEYRDLDRKETLGEQDAQNFAYLVLLLARLLEGRPLKKVVYFFSPRGRNSKRPIEELLRQLMGDYMATCKHSIFAPEKGGGETNSSVSLSREGVRILCGQEIDRQQKWSNAVLKRRADGGREGGALKYSNTFHEYDPVYTLTFGCNEPFHLENVPGNSESDRTLVIYLPNKFCDEEELRANPTSPRRFPKAEIDARLRDPRCGWGLLLILLQVRRSNPDLEDKVARGTLTSRYWKDQWFPKTGILFRETCTYRDAFGEIPLPQAVASFRQWSATSLNATFEYQTLRVKEIEKILRQSFGPEAFEKDERTLGGWSLRNPDMTWTQVGGPRVGMLKIRTPRELPRGPDGRFLAIREAGLETFPYRKLPTAPRKIISFWQSRGVLPNKHNGRALKPCVTKKNGDKINGFLSLRAAGCVTAQRSSVYRSIRPITLRQTKIPLAEANQILYDLAWGLSTLQIAAKRGGVSYTSTGVSQRKQTIIRLHHLLQSVVAYSEEKRFRGLELGGVGKEIEADAGKLGRNRKNAVG